MNVTHMKGNIISPRENKESRSDYLTICKFEKTKNQVSSCEYELSSREYGIVISIYVVRDFFLIYLFNFSNI